MTTACPNTFHIFKSSGDTLSITDVLLCSGASVAGPGQLYRLTFKASSTAQFTHVSFLPGLQFYNAGLYVNPSYSTDAVVQIGSPVGVPANPVSEISPRLSCAQNPFRQGTVFIVESPVGVSESLVVRDIHGRPVRHLESGAFGPGQRRVAWDGLSDSRVRLPAGVYLVTLQSGGRSVSTRVALLK